MPRNPYAQFVSSAPDPAQLAALGTLAAQLQDAEDHLADLERQVRNQKEVIKQLAERELPEALEAAGVSSLELNNGARVALKESIHVGSVTKEPAVLEWLIETGHSAKVKRRVTVLLGADADEAEADLVRELDGRRLDHSEDRWVEPATLRSHVAKLLKDGKPVDVDLLKVYRRNVAVITGPRNGGSVLGD